MCLQEVDKVQYEGFWVSQLEKLGYSTRFYRNNTKNHGCVIVLETSYLLVNISRS